MGLLGKLKFWKKNDDLNLNTELPPDMGIGMGDNMGLEQGSNDYMMHSRTGLEEIDNPSSFHEKSQYNTYQSVPQSNKELDLISSKLDTIKAELDAMNQRIQKIERIAESTEKLQKNDPKHQPVW